jgi:hypothetical protein
MLGDKFLQEGVVPTTTHVDLLRYGEKYVIKFSNNFIVLIHYRLDVENYPDRNQRIIHLPVDWLKDISLVDTPGTNAIFQNHQQITEHFIPRADLVLWVTSIDRAFSEVSYTSPLSLPNMQFSPLIIEWIPLTRLIYYTHIVE